MGGGLLMNHENGYISEDQLTRLIAKLSNVEWFSNSGKQDGRAEAEKSLKEWTDQLKLGEYKIVWLTTEQLQPFVENMNLGNSPVWSSINGIPKKLSEKSKVLGKQSVLSHTLDSASEMLFHKAFDGAFPTLNEYGERAVKVAVISVMYLFSLASVWEALSEMEESEPNPLLPLVKVFETGHWPVVMIDNQFYMV